MSEKKNQTERARFETPTDQVRERKLARWLGKYFGLEPVRNPDMSHIDYRYFKDGVLAGEIEFKCRREAFREIIFREGYMISEIRYDRIVAAEKAGLSFSIGKTDAWYWDGVPRHSLTHRWGGRTNKVRDAFDSEWVIDIPMSWCVKIH